MLLQRPSLSDSCYTTGMHFHVMNDDTDEWICSVFVLEFWVLAFWHLAAGSRGSSNSGSKVHLNPVFEGSEG